MKNFEYNNFETVDEAKSTFAEILQIIADSGHGTVYNDDGAEFYLLQSLYSHKNGVYAIKHNKNLYDQSEQNSILIYHVQCDENDEVVNAEELREYNALDENEMDEFYKFVKYDCYQ